ncbi:MAG: hypothetical protein LBH43_02695 [Treponema sp.]|nr:hypothetical protein [Treponema sp.]
MNVLPEGDSGIAAKYPGDINIESDSEVILADNFEDCGRTLDLKKRWSGFYNGEYISIVNDPSLAFSGTKALGFTIPVSANELSVAVFKELAAEQELDIVFFRYYSKYDGDFDVTGSSHNGGVISAHYYPNGMATPGIPSDGRNKFLASYENWRDGDPNNIAPNPGLMNIYIYHPEQRSEWGDHFFPPGYVSPFTYQPFDFGPDFIQRPDVVPELNRWYCYEFMVQANTPGKKDGRIACWIDGKLIADFTNMRLRDINSLKIDRLDLGLHIKTNTNSKTVKYYDNVVIAKSYIGPLK